MSKVNLLTIHYGENKGSFLQTWATKKILESLGHQVTIINLYDPLWSVTQRFSSLNRIKTIPNMLEFIRLRKKYLWPMTPLMTRIVPDFIPLADYNIVGSDQTWNPDITKENYLSYFLSFVPDSSQRIALSASFGVSVWKKFPQEKTESIRTELKKFKAVSVRESSGVDICWNQFGISGVSQICDPTIAWNDYSELTGPISDIPEIFAFLFRRTALALAVIDESSRYFNLPVRLSFKSNLSLHSHPSLKKYLAVSPLGSVSLRQFLHGIGGSRFVVTDSFHGTVFCLLNRKSFLVVGPEKNNDRFGRIQSLLDYLNLSERIVISSDDLRARKDKLFKPIVYDEHIESLLRSMRDNFMEFLHNNIV